MGAEQIDFLSRLSVLLQGGYGLASVFGGVAVYLFFLLRKEQREHLADVKASKAEYRESNPVLKELGDTLKAVRDNAKQPEESPLLRRVEHMIEVVQESLEEDRRGRRR